MKTFAKQTVRETLLDSSGFTLPTVLSFMIALGILSFVLMSIVVSNINNSNQIIAKQNALNTAEAGINYYLWHMSHNPGDYKDGNSTPTVPDPKLGYGPYEHDYIDSQAQKQGTYTLWIKPSGAGSTIMTVRSIGKTNDGVSRAIETRIGAASFASYGLLADVEFWFGESEVANGPVFSNQGIHMDGPNTDTVSSANATYVPQAAYGGNGSTKNGVWCSTTVTSPNCTSRDKSNWLFPRPSTDFNQVTGALCVMKKVAFANDNATAALATRSDACNQTPTVRTAAYVPRYSTTSFSNRRGYYIVLNNNSTYDLYRVSNEDDSQADVNSALTKSLVQASIALPSSGVIFVEDNVWVKTASNFPGRLTIAAGRLGNDVNKADINIVGDIKYSSKDGQDSIGLVAENNVIITPYAIPRTSSFTFEVDAATLAQSGSVTYPDTYKVNSNRCTIGWVSPNQQFLYYGSVATRQYWTWNYTRSNACGDAVYSSQVNRYISGIKNTTTSYDYNLYYAPPPSYPVTGGYDILNWREVLTTP